jgi:Zn-dependent protease
MSLEISKFRGVPIKLHFTLIIILVLLSWTLSSGFMPRFYPNLDPLAYWVMGVGGAVILIISVLLHELAHVIMSLKYGLEVRQIILFVFGGIADIKEETKEYKKEFRIAVVGPLASFGLALVFLLSWYFIFLLVGNDALPSSLLTGINTLERPLDSENQQTDAFSPPNSLISITSGVLIYSTVANTLVGAFNLLPAFPLDGGRILRALLVKCNKSYDEATKIAVRVGTGISFGLMAYGFITIFTGSAFGGFWFIIIGWFLQSAAQTYLQQHEISNKLSNLILADVMITNYIHVNSNFTVEQVIQYYFNIYRKSEFPILDNEGYLIGSISNRQINGVNQNKIHEIKITEIMTSANELLIMDKNSRADEALKQLYQLNKNRVYVGYHKNSLLNQLIKNNSVMRNEESQSSSPLSPKNNASDKIKLVGIVSKTDILNIARGGDEFKKDTK